MKRIFLAIIAALALLGCDKINSVDPTLIIGTWNEKYTEPNFVMDGSVTYTFNDDQTYSVKLYDALTGIEIDRKDNYSILANIITLDVHIADKCVKQVYTITKIDKNEMTWQKVGTSYQPGTNGGDFKRFVRVK